MRFSKKSLCRLPLMAMCGIVLATPLCAAVLVAADGSAPFIFTVMTHTDGTYSTEPAFLLEVAAIQRGIALYGLAGVKMNLEASKEFATADGTWSRAPGILKRTLDRGHGVGTHCNERIANQTLSPLELQTILTANKTLVDGLVGAANNVSISGICGKADWVTAAVDAGFKITDAGAGYCYLSMPLAARPRGWTDRAIRARYFHDPVPADAAKRVSPMKLQNAQDFVADAAGVLTFSNGELGELSSLSEGRFSCGTSCILEEADLQVVYDAIDRIAASKDPAKIGRINIHVPTRTFSPGNYVLLRSFLTRLKTYADAGTIVFGTQKDVLDTYALWP